MTEIAAAKTRVLVIGGYGFFGRRLVTLLGRQSSLEVIVAGRSIQRAEQLIAALGTESVATLKAANIDAMAGTFRDQLLQIAPDVVVHTSGPFQGQDYRVAEACIAAGAHYLDLADGRAFVEGITKLDEAATRARVLVTSGASSVPALSSAVVDRLATMFSELHAVDIGISPGNRTERGLSTIEAILSYCGKPLPANTSAPTFGWSGAYRFAYPAPVGSRLLSPCDVPDLTLLPARYSGKPTVRFGAGLELKFLHRLMNLMALTTRVGLVRNWSRYARWIKRAADLFQTWGTDAGAMHVSVTGRAHDGSDLVRTWTLVAKEGDGPYVPTLAAAALVRKLASGVLTRTGALPCMGLLTLNDFEREAEGLSIDMTIFSA